MAEAPKRIFTRPHAWRELSGSCGPSKCFEDDIEYVRADAAIEAAAEQMAEASNRVLVQLAALSLRRRDDGDLCWCSTDGHKEGDYAPHCNGALRVYKDAEERIAAYRTANVRATPSREHAEELRAALVFALPSLRIDVEQELGALSGPSITREQRDQAESHRSRLLEIDALLARTKENDDVK